MNPDELFPKGDHSEANMGDEASQINVGKEISSSDVNDVTDGIHDATIAGRDINQTSIAGRVTAGGDLVARDKTVSGDEVHGDKVDGDKVGGDKVGGDKIMSQGYVAIGGQVVHVHLSTPGPLPPPQQQEAPVDGAPPYQGLNYFGFADAHLFFGREQLTAELAAYLRTHRFLAVVGASGSGKSSLVRAGVIPALHYGQPLADGTLPPRGSQHWPIHIMQPKAHPLRELAATLLPDQESDLAQLRLMDELAQDARVLGLRASRLLSGGPANRLLLVVDQFEELFTLCKDAAERKAFVDNLLTAAVEDGVTTVVITLRADFYAHCFAFDNLRAALEGEQKTIGPMTKDELRRAIEEPARLGGWELEKGLVELLLADVGNEPGALPLLSHALLETWKRRRGRTLTLTGYAESGRVQGAIAHTAEAVFKQLATPEQQAIAKNIFLRLTELGEGAEDTRRRAQLTELIPRPEAQTTIEAVLTTLADARLITTDKGEAEVAHEALIRNWPRLRTWLDEDREGLRIERRMAEAACEWNEFHRNERLLYAGSRFAQAWEWVRNKLDSLSQLELEFIQTSRTLVEVEQRQLKVESLLHEARTAKQVGNAQSAIAALEQASQLDPALKLDVATEIQDVRRQVATQLVQAGERLAVKGDYAGATVKFKEALAMEPPLDTPVYVWIPSGEFLMGFSEVEHAITQHTSLFSRIQRLYLRLFFPAIYDYENRTKDFQHTVYINGFWIMRVPVTNAQYKRSVEAGACTPPANRRWDNPQFAKHPVTNVTWHQAIAYAHWVGGRLPTEAEWEKAARGTDGRNYPWGNHLPTHELCNYFGNGMGTWTAVDSYPKGGSPYGVLDMAGNVWEWTSSKQWSYPYDLTDGREDLEGDDYRILRGGSWDFNDARLMHCAFRFYSDPGSNKGTSANGFRVVILSPGL